MRRYSLAGIVILVLCIIVGFFIFKDQTIIMPKPDNETPAEQLITKIYSEAELEKLFYYDANFNCYYLKDLKGIRQSFKIECVRDPKMVSSAGQDYPPYFVLMCENGTKTIIFWDKAYDGREWYVWTDIVQFQKLPSAQEVISTAEELSQRHCEIDVWLNTYDGLISGTWYGAAIYDMPILSKEGIVLVNARTSLGIPIAELENTTLYSDTELLSEEFVDMIYWKPYVILPIDK